MVEPCDELQSGGRVLLIEERPELSATIARSLDDKGYQTLTTQSVADARAAVARGEVALVLLSFRLFNRLGGKDFLDELRATARGAFCPSSPSSTRPTTGTPPASLDFEDYLPTPSPRRPHPPCRRKLPLNPNHPVRPP